VRDRDDPENDALVGRYGRTRETFPVIVLVQHDRFKNKTRELTYPSDLEVNSDLLRKWMKKNSRVSLPSDGNRK
jgi:hypothetical protein